MSELNTLFPGVDVKLNSGEVITIKPIPFGKMAKVTSISVKLMGFSTLAQDVIGKVENPTIAIDTISGILVNGGEDVYELLGLGLNKDRAWFDTIDMEDGIKLLHTFLEVNADFFIKSVLPHLVKVKESAASKLKNLGPSLS